MLLKWWQKEPRSLLLFSCSALTISGCAVCLIQPKRIVVPQGSQSAVQQLSPPGCSVATGALPVTKSAGAGEPPGLGKEEERTGMRNMGVLKFFPPAPRVVHSVATADEFSQGRLFQSCQPPVFLDLASERRVLHSPFYNFRKSSRNKLCCTSKIRCTNFVEFLNCF